MNVATKLVKNISNRHLTLINTQSVRPNRTLSSMATNYKYETLNVTNPKKFVYNVELNRPDKLNAMNKSFWREIRECFTSLNEETNCRVVVLSGAGQIFTSGLDFTDVNELIAIHSSEEDLARRARAMHKIVTEYQSSFVAIEKCNKPVIAAVHGACIGGGVNMISACDIRLCTSDAWFQIKEVDLGIAADVGALQFLPKAVGNGSLMRELVFTGRKLFADEALAFGMVSRVLPVKEDMMLSVLEMAEVIASKSPVAVQGAKLNLNYSRDHSVQEGLDYMAKWNMTHLLSEDLMKAAMAVATKSKELPVFAKY